MDDLWTKRFGRIKALGIIGAVGIVFAIGAFFTPEPVSTFLSVAGLFFVVPAFVYLYCTTILHWKSRYRGKHSDLWGVILLVEASGWFKIVYLFRHIVPDMSRSGRYRLDSLGFPDNSPSLRLATESSAIPVRPTSPEA